MSNRSRLPRWWHIIVTACGVLFIFLLTCISGARGGEQAGTVFVGVLFVIVLAGAIFLLRA